MDALLLAEFDQLLLRVEGVDLDLVYCRLDCGAVEQVPQYGDAEVTDADVADQALLDQLLHGAPGVDDGHT